MDATLNAVVDLLIKAVPTAIFFLFLAAYLKQVYFKPMANILQQRREATEGLRELSQRAFDSADKKTSELERAIHLARAEINAENEKLRQQWVLEQAETIARARAAAEVRLADARYEIAREVEQVGIEMEGQIQPLTDKILNALSRRRAA